MIIAGIGSRKIAAEAAEWCTSIGKFCLERDIWVRSGHAEGADWAFEQGAQQKCIAYLPWPTFNKQLKSHAHLTTIPPEYWDGLDALAKQYHPHYSKLSQGAKLLMRRNGAQILGMRLEQPVDAVVCYSANLDLDGKVQGGTGQALRIAESRDIPIFNLYDWYVPDVIQELFQIREKLDAQAKENKE